MFVELAKDVGKRREEAQRRKNPLPPESRTEPLPLTEEEILSLTKDLSDARTALSNYFSEDTIIKVTDRWIKPIIPVGRKNIEGIRSRFLPTLHDEQFGGIPLEVTIGTNFMSDAAMDSIKEYCIRSDPKGRPKRMRHDWDAISAELENQVLWIDVESREFPSVSYEVLLPPTASINLIPHIIDLRMDNRWSPRGFATNLQRSILHANAVSEFLQNSSL